jgi:MerR family transcriptional regulator, light-induced transcriptional regulator
MGKSSTKRSWGSFPESSEIPSELRLLGLSPGERGDLLSTIHEQIIPQLVLAHASESGVQLVCADARLPPSDEEVWDFAHIAVSQDLTRALAFVELLSSQGISLEGIFLHLVSPAARLLGAMWEDDTKTFAEVTLGLSTLQKVVHVLGPSFAPGVGDRGSVVLTTTEPEQHTLGIFLLGEFLRRAGWGVHVAPGISNVDLIDLVRSEWIAMVGISVSNADLVEPLKLQVAMLKHAPRNPHMALMIGGSAAVAEIAEEVGATYCSDPNAAVAWLDRQHAAIRVKPAS